MAAGSSRARWWQQSSRDLGVAAAVELDDDGEILAGDGGFSREEEAELEVPRGVDGSVGGGDAVHWFCRGRDFEIQEAQEAAVNGAVTAETFVAYDY